MLNLFLGLVSLSAGHKLMLSFNCQGMPGMGRTVQNVAEDCLDATFLQAPVSAYQLRTLEKTAQAASDYGLQYIADWSSLKPTVFEDLSSLDSELSALIAKGAKVVLLGEEENIAPRVNVADHEDIDRRPLAVEDEAKSSNWEDFPAKNFDNCGLIKIDPTFKIGETSYTLGDSGTWTCNVSDGLAQFNLPTTTDQALQVTFAKASDVVGSYEYITMSFKFGETSYLAEKELPLDNLTKPGFSYTCYGKNIKGGESTITIGAYQAQPIPAAYGSSFGVAVDCTPLFGEMVWVTLIGFILLTLILAAALAAILAIETPSKFETPRSKPLIIPDVQ